MAAESLMADARAVSRSEELLADHPEFGEAGLIWQRAEARLRFAVEVLGEQLPGVARVLGLVAGKGCLPQVLRDPLVRMATEAALQRLALGGLVGGPDGAGGPGDLVQVLGQAAASATPGDDRVPTQIDEGCGMRAGPGGWIWLLGFPGSPGPLAGRLARACAENFIELAGRTGELNPGTRRTAELVDRACDLLGSVLPELAPQVIRHVTALGMVTAAGQDGVMLSAAGGAPLPGLIMIRPGQLERPWDAAGRILHEALHLKLFDICVSCSLIANPGSGASVPWRPDRWDIRRVLAAFHVYTHLTLFQAAARTSGRQLAGKFGDPPDNPGVSPSPHRSYQRPEQRLGYLAEQLAGPLADDLTLAGRRFVAWQLDAIAPFTGWQISPARPGQPTARDAHPAAGYERARGIVARLDPRTRSGLIFNPGSGLLHVVNLAGWVAFNLCDGRDLDALRRSYADVTASKLTATEAAGHLDTALTQLREASLITAATDPAASQERR